MKYSMISSTLISIAYGIPSQTGSAVGDNAASDGAGLCNLGGLIVLAETANEAINSAPSSGAVVLDIFPVLKHFPSWFPGLGFLAKLPEWQKLAREVREIPFEFGKTLIVSSTISSRQVTLWTYIFNIGRGESTRILCLLMLR
jgi:hypothetical protein